MHFHKQLEHSEPMHALSPVARLRLRRLTGCGASGPNLKTELSLERPGAGEEAGTWLVDLLVEHQVLVVVGRSNDSTTMYM